MLSIWNPAPSRAVPALRLYQPTPTHPSRLTASAGEPTSRPRNILPFRAKGKKNSKEEERLEELHDLRRRLVRLIVQYESERKNIAR